MPKRGPLARLLLGSGLVLGGAVGLAGAIALGGAGLVATGVAGGVSAALAAGVARESPTGSRTAATEAAWKAAAGTVGGLLLVSGVVVLAGGVVATLVTCLVAVGALAAWYLRTQRRRAAAGRSGPAVPPSAPSPLRPVTPLRGAAWTDAALLPVGALPTPELGLEWLRTTAALGGRLDPATRQAVVRRRGETLDELERRDPGGFVRWLAAGPGADPAQFVRGDVRGDTAAGTDAA